MDMELYITELRQHTAELNQAMMKLREKRRVWVSQGMDQVLTQNDLNGANANLMVADIINVMTSIGAIDSLLITGHSTNLDRVARF